MGELSTTEARNEFASVFNRAAYGKERVVVTRRDRERVAVIPIEDLELLEELEDADDVRAAREALTEDGPPIPWETLKEDLDL